MFVKKQINRYFFYLNTVFKDKKVIFLYKYSVFHQFRVRNSHYLLNFLAISLGCINILDKKYRDYAYYLYR